MNNEWIDIKYLCDHMKVLINGEPFSGSLSIGDTIEVLGGATYRVDAINEDGALIKELREI